MNPIIQVMMMALIGALIGGLTNTIAIKMLFRPYEAKYLFGKRLPFTPGVIPLRRDEASTKLGEIITGHLLTPEVFEEKLKSTETDKLIMHFIDRQIETIETERLTPGYFLERLSSGLTEKIVTSFNEEIRAKVFEEGQKLYVRTINDIMPEDALHAIDNKVSHLAYDINDKLVQYISSDKGFHDIYTMVDEFTENRGRLARSLKYVMTKESMTERVQTELLKLIQQEKMINIETRVIEDEYNKLKQSGLSELVTSSDLDNILNSIIEVMQQKIDIRKILNTPITDFNKDLFIRF
jgi:Uncharacterized protein conserved in bacteria